MRIVIAIFLALAAASPAAAQSTDEPVGSIIPKAKPASMDHEGTFKGDAARRVIDDFTACVLGRRRRPVMEALALPSGSLEQNQAFGKLRVSECITSGELRFNGETFRGGFYTALVRSKFGKSGASLGPEPADYTKPSTPGSDVPPSPYLVPLLNFASCVIHKDPENARIAIVATAGSPKEEAAITALANQYEQCLHAGTALRFSKANLIGLLAEAYYREGNASTQ